MDTRQLRAFIKIAELGSISRAAEALGLTQPSLSQQLLRLEDEAGLKLFERTARGVTLTDAGRMFEPHARQILEQSSRAIEELRLFKAEARTRVALAMPFSVSKMIGVALTKAAIELRPSVALRIVEAFHDPIRTLLRSGSVDLGLLYDAESLEGLSVRRLAREELCLIGPPGRWPAVEQGGTIATTELARLALILPGPGHGLRQFLEQTTQRLGFRLQVATEIDSLQHIVDLVAGGHGLAVMPLSAVERELEAGTLSAVRIGEGAFEYTLCLARRADAVASDAVRVVEELTIRTLQSMIARRRWIAEPGDGPR